MFFFQAEDGIRDLVRSRGLGDVYKRQANHRVLKVHRGSVTILPAELGNDAGMLGAASLLLSLIHI